MTHRISTYRGLRRSCSVVILCCIGGCSASAIGGGVAIETSMGLTPVQGLVMGT